MVTAHIHGRTEINTLVNTKMGLRMAMVYIFIQMAIFMKASGEMDTQMEEET